MLKLTLEQTHLVEMMTDEIMDKWVEFGDVEPLEFYHEAGQHWQNNFTPMETAIIVEDVVHYTFG
tara:strand:+ start:339 stop:533 length:195 start_codon:yes stop_codon:yes gene_type:complete